jgi:hypothetical protein
MPLLTDPGFKGSEMTRRPKLSRTFIAARAAVAKMMFTEFWSEGFAIILTEEEVAVMPLLGLCLAGWAKKQGKACGRPITNGGSLSMRVEEIINSPYTKHAAIETFGPINHPVIGDMPRMMMGFERTTGHHPANITLWKFDLKKAYLLLTYAAEDVPKI